MAGKWHLHRSDLGLPAVESAHAGTELVLEAEMSGRLKEQHTFLYATAGDLRVIDVSKLLSQYKVHQATCLLRCGPTHKPPCILKSHMLYHSKMIRCS